VTLLVYYNTATALLDGAPVSRFSAIGFSPLCKQRLRWFARPAAHKNALRWQRITQRPFLLLLRNAACHRCLPLPAAHGMDDAAPQRATPPRTALPHSCTHAAALRRRYRDCLPTPVYALPVPPMISPAAPAYTCVHGRSQHIRTTVPRHLFISTAAPPGLFKHLQISSATDTISDTTPFCPPPTSDTARASHAQTLAVASPRAAQRAREFALLLFTHLPRR